MKLGMTIQVLLPCILALAVAQGGGSSKPPVPASVELEVGQKAPSFSATDQFGREQSNQTLQGPQGTVLLFFRSADW